MADHQNSKPPFEGIRVIDFTHVLAGPAATYQLALLGADVIKIEELGVGDAVRNRGGTSKKLIDMQMGTNFLAQNANKRSLAVNIKSSEGQDIIKQLATDADVFVENHRAETLPRYGLSGADLTALNTRLIYCSMTGYGHSGPKYNAPAYDVNIQAASGFMSLTGTPEVSPLRAGAPIMDYATGLAGAYAITAALYQRMETGRGQLIDISMLDVAFSLMSSTVTNTLTTGNQPKPKGNQANSGLPTSGNFPTGDGLLSLGLNEEHQFSSFAEIVGREDWLEDNRFSSMAGRAANSSAISSELVDTLKSRSAEEWEQILQPAGIPAARVRSLPDMLGHVQARERGIIQSVKNIEGHDQDVGVVVTPFRMGEGGGSQINRPPPRLGQHSLEILEEMGYDSDYQNRLVKEGVIGAG